MTSDQAAALIAQNDRILALYDQVLPLFQTFTHDVFPFLAVLGSWFAGAVLATAAT